MRPAPDSSNTRLILEHRDIELHGEGASAYREALNSKYGWPFILDRFSQVSSA